MLEMRVGICYCASHLTRIFTGQTLEFYGQIYCLRGVPTSRPSKYRQELAKNRCSFFLDEHIHQRRRSRSVHLVELRLLELISNGEGRGPKLYIGGLNKQDLRGLGYNWEVISLPPVEEMIHQMKVLIEKLPTQRLPTFLARVEEGADGQKTG